MFVRWRRRESTKWVHRDTQEPFFSLYAVLVESYRVDGRVRQRFVAHLASYHDIPNVDSARQRFHAQAKHALDGLSIAPDARSRIDAALLARIPMPEPSYLAAVSRIA